MIRRPFRGLLGVSLLLMACGVEPEAIDKTLRPKVDPEPPPPEPKFARVVFTDCRAYPMTGPQRVDGRDADDPPGPREYCYRCGWQAVGHHAVKSPAEVEP